jgi:hypothetical protein
MRPRAIFGAALLAATCATSASAQLGADLNISPKRVVLDQGERSATVYVFNQGDRPATYRITLVDRQMAPDGDIVDAGAAAPARSARSLIEYTPRVITLEPKRSQAIRIRVRRPEAPGEYRSHLTVTPQPTEDAGLTAAQAAAEARSDALAVRVVALFSLSIPVIVRSGPVEARAIIEKPAIVPGRTPTVPPSVTLDLVRQGTGSLYGDVEIYAGQGKGERQVGRVRGIAVYPEIARRSFTAALSGAVNHGEKLRIIYRDDDVRPGTELATVSLVAP